MSDNCDHNFGTFDDFGVKNDQKVSHNMICQNIRDNMVEKGSKNSGKALPPLFGQCPQEINFCSGRCTIKTICMYE